MKHVASTVLIVVSTLLLGFYALVWLLGIAVPTSSDSRAIFVNAIGTAGLAFAALAFRELRRQRAEALRLQTENEEFV